MFSHRTTKVHNEMKSPPGKRESRVNPVANESSSEVDQVLLDCGAGATGSLVLIDEETAATVTSSGRNEFPEAPILTPLKTRRCFVAQMSKIVQQFEVMKKKNQTLTPSAQKKAIKNNPL